MDAASKCRACEGEEDDEYAHELLLSAIESISPSNEALKDRKFEEQHTVTPPDPAIVIVEGCGDVRIVVGAHPFSMRC